MSTQYGWRARVGHISPALLDTSAEECRKLLPPGGLHVGLSISQPVQRMALDLLGMRRVVVVSPFVEARNEEIRSYLAAVGITVVAARGLGLPRNVDIARQSAATPYQMARALVG